MKTPYDQINDWLEEVCDKINGLQIQEKDKDIIKAEIHSIQWWTIENMIKKITRSAD